jgi:hypothetical protein
VTDTCSSAESKSSCYAANERLSNTNARRGNSFSAAAGLVVLLASLYAPLPARGVILWSTGDPTYNTTEPTGALAGSGWQYEGDWGSFLGTPIAPGYFITARHVGGAVGDTFSYQGVNYTTVACYDDPGSDLRIWKINGLFPTFAPLYSCNDEMGKSLVVFGRGTQRGDPIYNELPAAQASLGAPPAAQLLLCGSAPGKSAKSAPPRLPTVTPRFVFPAQVAVPWRGVGRSNGTSAANRTVPTQGNPPWSIPPPAASEPVAPPTPAPETEPTTGTPAPTGDTTTPVTAPNTPIIELKGWQWGAFDGLMRWGENQVDAVIAVGGSVGDLLRAAFDAGVGPNEAHLSSGDSGGAVFINDGTVWKLAGINYAVDGPYKTSPTGTPFYGAIFDVCGLYLDTYLLPEEDAPVPSHFYATRISTRLDWIQSVINQP